MKGASILIGATCVLLTLSSCAEREVPPAAMVDAEDRPDQETWDVQFDIEIDGSRRARLTSAYAARFERDSTFIRFGPADTERRVRVLVYDDAGELSATVVSDRLDYLEDRRKFVATGDVVVDSETGRRLEGERLVWDEAAGEIRSDGFVRITTPTERLQGYRLVADESLDTYRLSRITGQVEVEDL